MFLTPTWWARTTPPAALHSRGPYIGDGVCHHWHSGGFAGTPCVLVGEGTYCFIGHSGGRAKPQAAFPPRGAREREEVLPTNWVKCPESTCEACLVISAIRPFHVLS